MHESDRDRATQEEKRKTTWKKEKIDMKANELMLGDWVTFRDSLEEKQIIPVKIVVLRDNDNDFLAQIDGDEMCDELEFNDEIVGIPITPEILKKNGFVYNNSPFVQSWEQFGLSLYLGGDGYRINCGQNVAMVIDSVHQLQHALRLCGIELDIKL